MKKERLRGIAQLGFALDRKVRCYTPAHKEAAFALLDAMTAEDAPDRIHYETPDFYFLAGLLNALVHTTPIGVRISLGRCEAVIRYGEKGLLALTAKGCGRGRTAAEIAQEKAKERARA